MAKRIKITEEEAWAEVDRYFHSYDKQEDEYDTSYFMDKYKLSRTATNVRLKKLVKDGILTVRRAHLSHGMANVYKFTARSG